MAQPQLHSIATSVQPAATPSTRRIPLPSRNRPPLKANIYEKMQSANSQLTPLFPYVSDGCVVPCGAVFRGGREYGQFFHENTQDEAVVAFGSQGSILASGQVFVGSKAHGVSSFLKNPKDPKSFLVVCVTQLQSEGLEQKESVIFRCRKCSDLLFRHDFGTVPPPADREGEAEHVPALETLIGSYDAAVLFNESEEKRTCGKCGLVNVPFPLDLWGWDAYTFRSRTVNEARRALVDSAKAQLGG